MQLPFRRQIFAAPNASAAAAGWLWHALAQAVGFAIAVATLSYAADAHAFAPMSCPPSPGCSDALSWRMSSWEYPLNPYCGSDAEWSARGFPGGIVPREGEPNPNLCPRYPNRTEIRRRFRASSYATSVRFNVTHLDLANSGDTLTFDNQSLPPAPVSQEGWHDVPTAFNAATPGLDIVFSTDDGRTATGFLINEVQLCCDGGNGNGASYSTTLEFTRRETGVLLGPGDVVYYRTRPLYNEGTTLGVSTWLDEVSFGVINVDLYAKCGSYPTETDYTIASRSADPEELIRLPYEACPDDVWYIAVTSDAGRGMYNIMAAPIEAELTLNVGIEPGVSEAHVEAIVDTVKSGARYVFGATEGQYLIHRINVFKTLEGSCWDDRYQCPDGYLARCDYCFTAPDDDSFGDVATAPPDGDAVRHHYPFDQPADEIDTPFHGAIMAHELVHYLFGFADEYSKPMTTRSQCPYSIMTIYPDVTTHNLCTEQTHGVDAHPLADPMPWWLIPFWTDSHPYFSEITTSELAGTPDNYDFRYHDMSGRVTVYVF